MMGSGVVYKSRCPLGSITCTKFFRKTYT